MQIKINSTFPTDTSIIEQKLNFYLSRFGHLVAMMKIELSDRVTQPGQVQYCIQLDARLNDGQHIELEENQSDLKVATQRILDRLYRGLKRRQSIRFHLAS